MKYYLCFVVWSVLMIGSLQAQQTYDTAPVFAEGKLPLSDFLELYSRYPQEAIDKKQAGVVRIHVRLNNKGENIGTTVVQSVSPSLDKEALRVAELFPPWTPAQKGGKAVACEYPVDFVFELDESMKTGAKEKHILFVVDGKILENDKTLDISNLKSVRVLKGKHAVAKFGDRARDGVVIFTTK